MLHFFSSNMPSHVILAAGLAYILVVFFAVSVHEFSHAYVAYKCGDMTAKVQGRLTLNPFAHLDIVGILCFVVVGFGWAKPVPVNPMSFRKYKKSMIFVSLSGIMVNLLIAFIFIPVLMTLPEIYVNSNWILIFAKYVVEFLVYINLSLAIFNLIPIYPLDGFNFINIFLKYGNAYSDFMMRYGGFIMLLFIISGLFGIVFNFVIDGLYYIFSLFWGLMI